MASEIAVTRCFPASHRAVELVKHDGTRFLQDTSTLAVIETPPSQTWQLAFNPSSDELLLAAAGGSGNKVVVWAPEEQVGRQELPLPEVGYSTIILLSYATPSHSLKTSLPLGGTGREEIMQTSISGTGRLGKVQARRVIFAQTEL